MRPPGAVTSFDDVCSRCNDCADACPEGIIAIAADDGRPYVDFERGACTFCAACAEVCPSGALDAEQLAFRHHAQLTTACIALDGVLCSLCEDSCPVDALRFKPVIGGKRIPAIDAQACTGCGACQHMCPNQAIRSVPHPAGKQAA